MPTAAASTDTVAPGRRERSEQELKQQEAAYTLHLLGRTCVKSDHGSDNLI